MTLVVDSIRLFTHLRACVTSITMAECSICTESMTDTKCFTCAHCAYAACAACTGRWFGEQQGTPCCMSCRRALDVSNLGSCFSSTAAIKVRGASAPFGPPALRVEADARRSCSRTSAVRR